MFICVVPAAAPDADGRSSRAARATCCKCVRTFWGREMPLLAGRSLRAQDDARAPRVAVVNQTFAQQYFPGENPVGKRFSFNPKKPDEVEIIGLARDAKYSSQREEIPPTLYLSWRQDIPGLGWGATYEVRTIGDPAAAVMAIRQAVREVDQNLPLNNIKTQIEQADETLARERLFAKLLTLFGLLAQLLAAIGLFGVMSYAVSQRTREIGIRMALGANRFGVLRMILRQGMTLAFFGVALGLVGAYALTQYLESRMDLSQMLYGVNITDPLTYAMMAALLILVALVACYVPARRATKVNPMIALRNE
ncbi:MAG: FtsX-like permease family protein [Pyrinomonadaceae bacterium]